MKTSIFRVLGCMMLIAAMALSMAACAPAAPAESNPAETTAAPTETTAEAFTMAKTEYSFTKLGQSEVLEASAADVVYTSADEAVAVVTGNALIAVGNGATTVTAAHAGEEVVIMVNVASDAAVHIDGERMVQLNTADNASASLTASVAVPTIFDNPAAGVIWSSSNPEVATVDAAGVVTAVGSGVTQITAVSDYQITSTTTQSVMGMTVTDTEEAIAPDTITVMVNNEYDAAQHAGILGTYEAHYDWMGFAQQASEENPCYTAENMQWIRSRIVLELREDGTFTQKVLNAQRADYPAEIDETLPESTFEEQVAKYGKKGCYIYNSFDQDPAAEEFASEADKTFAAIEGMPSKGMRNFAEDGYFMVLDGQLILFYGHVNGFTGEYEASQFVYGPVADNAFAANVYVPFKNLVAMSSNMSAVLEKNA